MINPNDVKNYEVDKESITMANGTIAIIATRRQHILKDLLP
jgi:hypothetical protein